MKLLTKPAIILGIAGVMALGSVTASQARVRPWVAGAAGFAAGAAIGSAAASSAYYGDGYYNSGYYGDSYAAAPYGSYDPAYANTGDPNSASYGYNSYAYSPGYRSYGYGYDARTSSWPPHRDPGYGYNSNTISPWQDRKLQGGDY